MEKNTEIRPSEILATFKTNSFSGNPLGAIILATAVGLCTMFLGIAIGAPVWLSMLLLLGGILLIFGFQSGKAEYHLFTDRIERVVHPAIPYAKVRHLTVPLSRIRSYRRSKDLSRSGRETEQLKIQLRMSPGTIWLSDQVFPDQFTLFADRFEEAVLDYNSRVKTQKKADHAKPLSPVSHNADLPITKKRNWYKGTFAKLLSVFFLFFTVVIFFFYLKGSLSYTSMWRLFIILIPGTIYMLYRSFIKRDNQLKD